MCRELLVMAELLLGGQGETGQAMVVLRTTMGDITIAVDAEHAPKPAANSLRYVDGGYYEGGRFHRTVRLDNQPGKKVLIEVVQAGPNPPPARKDFPPILLERTKETGLKHLRGTVSMARGGPDAATPDFVILCSDQPEREVAGSRDPRGPAGAA